MENSSLPPLGAASAAAAKPKRRSPLLILASILVGLIVVVLIAIQLIPVNRTNPAVTTPIKWDSPQTEALARRACMDCHSNETVWPWYSYVAPTSWLVYYDVQRGRSQLNFSTLSSGQRRGNPGGQANNDLAYQLGQILAGGGEGGEGEPRGFGGPGDGNPNRPPNGQFPTRTPGQQGSGRPFFPGGGLINQITENIQNNRMPPSNYLLLHPSAGLTSQERQQLLQGLQATFGLSNP